MEMEVEMGKYHVPVSEIWYGGGRGMFWWILGVFWMLKGGFSYYDIRWFSHGKKVPYVNISQLPTPYHSASTCKTLFERHRNRRTSQSNAHVILNVPRGVGYSILSGSFCDWDGRTRPQQSIISSGEDDDRYLRGKKYVYHHVFQGCSPIVRSQSSLARCDVFRNSGMAWAERTSRTFLCHRTLTL